MADNVTHFLQMPIATIVGPTLENSYCFLFQYCSCLDLSGINKEKSIFIFLPVRTVMKLS